MSAAAANWTAEQIQQTVAQVMQRSTTDPKFRSLAISQPEAAIGEITNTPIPENFKVRFVDGSDANMTLVLPPVASAEGELSDAQLEQVAGGRGGLRDVGNWFTNNFGPGNAKSLGNSIMNGASIYHCA